MSRLHVGLALAAAVLGLAAAGAEGPDAAVDATALAVEIEAERDHITAPALAARIIAQDPALHVVDLRPRAAFEEWHIPTATHATLEALATRTFPREARIVLYSEGGTHSAQGWVLLRLRGQRDVRFLREGIYEWLSRVMEPRLAEDATPAERAEFERAAELSRFFGGQPRAGVARAEVPQGYWSAPGTAAGDAETSTAAALSAAASTLTAIRRRGC